jgi:hypothetical protein
MNTDSEGRIAVWLCFALGPCPVNGFAACTSVVLVVLICVYLCPSVVVLKSLSCPARAPEAVSWALAGG